MTISCSILKRQIYSIMTLNEGYIVGGRYRVIRRLGSGGFGTTYLVKDIHQETSSPPIVLKQIPKTANSLETRNTLYFQQIEQEAKILEKLTHDRIPKFLDAIEEEGYFYIIQEFIEGDTLQEELSKQAKISESKAIEILVNILEVLKYVHQEKRIIHRDLKPGNLIRRKKDGKICLIDFGAVKEIKTVHKKSSGVLLTKAIGTPGYMPGEQLSGNPQFNSDLYALGIIIIQVITGLTIEEIEHLPRDPEGNLQWSNLATDVSDKFKNIVSLMVKYNFKERYESVGQILPDLHQLQVDQMQFDRTIISPQTNLSSNSKKWFQCLAALATSGILCTFALYQFTSKPKCNAEVKNDYISSGEAVLNPQSQGSIRELGTKDFTNCNYQNALAHFQDSWHNERRDAETLIYMNNAFLEAAKINYYTIAIAVPLSSQKEVDLKNSDLGQKLLRGIAQAQTEVNLNLIDSDQNQENISLDRDLDFLKFHTKTIDRQQKKGLKVIIIDDGNNKEQAQTVAEAISKSSQILGIIGHYASDLTLETVDIYQNNNLALISSGSTTGELSNPNYYRPNFFRTIFNNEEYAETFSKYILEQKIKNKKVAIFYNPNSPFTNSLYIALSNKIKPKNIKIVKEFNLADDINFNAQIALNEANRLGANILVLIPDGQVTNSVSQALQIIKADNGKSQILGAETLINLLENPQINSIKQIKPFSNLVVSSAWHSLTSPNLEFPEDAQQLWQENVSGVTALTYDATLAFINAIKQQENPTRQGTLTELSAPGFSFFGATGDVRFNTPNNGDRINLKPNLVHLVSCQREDNHVLSFVPLDDAKAAELNCPNKELK